MLSSLVLLLVFIFLWLRAAYVGAYDDLKKETNYLFSHSIQDIESSLIDELILDPILFHQQDSFRSTQINVSVSPAADSAKVLAFVEARKIGRVHADSAREVVVHGEKEVEEREIMGTLSLFVDLRDSIPPSKDSLAHIQDDTIIIKLLEEHFSDRISKSSIPVGYRVVKLEDSSCLHKVFLSNSYSDIASGQSFAVEYPQYMGYLIMRILPQILFSLILFSCVSLAFYFIYKSLQEQRRLGELKNDFISNVTHELKTPITTVGVAIEALSNFDALQNPARTQEYLDISQNELNRLSILVDKVLQMSLFEKKEPDLKIEKFDLHVLISEILNSMKLQLERNNAKLDFQTDGNDFSLEGDRTHLTSVVYNLLDNALKYSKKSPEIQLTLEEKEDQLLFSIRDNGIGISPEYKEKIFEKFFRVPSGERHNVKGYGLGLSYVAGVIKKHQGWIQVESARGEGTHFTIQLPKEYEKN